MSAEREQIIHELENIRSVEHIGGRKKESLTSDGDWARGRLEELDDTVEPLEEITDDRTKAQRAKVIEEVRRFADFFGFDYPNFVRDVVNLNGFNCIS